MGNNNRKLRGKEEFPIWYHILEKKVWESTLEGYSLENIGILEGDKLTIQYAQKWNEDQIFAWEISANKYGQSFVTACFAFDNFGDICLSTNDERWLRYKKSEVRLIGLIIKIEREIKASKVVL